MLGTVSRFSGFAQLFSPSCFRLCSFQRCRQIFFFPFFSVFFIILFVISVYFILTLFKTRAKDAKFSTSKKERYFLQYLKRHWKHFISIFRQYHCARKPERSFRNNGWARFDIESSRLCNWLFPSFFAAGFCNIFSLNSDSVASFHCISFFFWDLANSMGQLIEIFLGRKKMRFFCFHLNFYSASKWFFGGRLATAASFLLPEFNISFDSFNEIQQEMFKLKEYHPRIEVIWTSWHRNYGVTCQIEIVHHIICEAPSRNTSNHLAICVSNREHAINWISHAISAIVFFAANRLVELWASNLMMSWQSKNQ